MFKVLDTGFNECLEFLDPVSEDVFNRHNVTYFDSDGFELSGLEIESCKTNGIELSSILNHKSECVDWIVGGNENLIIDHCCLLHRRKYSGDALDQIVSKASQLPQLTKYARLVPKWGLDFALEYYNGSEAIEVMHIENDYRSLDEAFLAKEKLEKKILSTDWYEFSKYLIKHKEWWNGLQGFEQNNWKSAQWGLVKAENTVKAFI